MPRGVGEGKEGWGKAPTFLAFLLLASTAQAHALLRSADPSAGSALSDPPTEVVLGFSEGVEPKFSSIEVQDAQGKRVDTGGAHRFAGDSRHLAVGLLKLVPGTYKVIWHATSVDTHRTQGDYSFSVSP